MQRGGFNITPLRESDFKYTIDPNRKLWTKNVFPIADYLIDAVLKIPWHTYRFEGNCSVWYGKEKERKRGNRWNIKNAENGIFEYNKIQANIKAKPQDRPYYFFGGCVYEILDRLYGQDPGVPKLRSFVDPTGDLDVYLRLPKITSFVPLNASNPNDPFLLDYVVAYSFEESPPTNPNDPNTVTLNTYKNRPGKVRNTTNCPSENAVQTSKDARTYNALIDGYTTWIMEHFAKNLLAYKQGGTLWNSLFGNTVPFSIDEDTEGSFADKIICIDNLKIVRSFLPYMEKIKIQLIAKFDGMDRSDHICEFLLPMANTLSDSLYLQYGNNRDADQLQKGIFFSSFFELVQGNEDGAKNRMPLMVRENRHKFYNHIMRMAYLNAFFDVKVNRFNERNGSKIYLKPVNYSSTMFHISEYCLFILDTYFKSETFLALDYLVINTLNKNTLQRLRTDPTTSIKKAELLNRLIGNFPKFMMEKKYGTYFFTGGATYVNLLEHTAIQEWLVSLPPSIKEKMKISTMDETLAIPVDKLYRTLEEMKIISFE